MPDDTREAKEVNMTTPTNTTHPTPGEAASKAAEAVAQGLQRTRNFLAGSAPASPMWLMLNAIETDLREASEALDALGLPGMVTPIVDPPKRYRHYEGGTYRMICSASHTDTRQSVIVYQSEQDTGLWARPATEFTETLPDGRKRFTLIEEPAPAARADVEVWLPEADKYGNYRYPDGSSIEWFHGGKSGHHPEIKTWDAYGPDRTVVADFQPSKEDAARALYRAGHGPAAAREGGR